MGFLSNKRILITGMLSNRSIAYGTAQAMRREGAELAFTYQGERIRDRVGELAREFDSELILPCDVSSDEDIEKLFSDLGKHWEKFDGFVHPKNLRPALREVRMLWSAQNRQISPSVYQGQKTISQYLRR